MTHLPVYVEATLKECMRKYPVANRGSLRLVRDPAGYTIPLNVLNHDIAAKPSSTSAKYKFDKEVFIPQDTWVSVNLIFVVVSHVFVLLFLRFQHIFTIYTHQKRIGVKIL